MYDFAIISEAILNISNGFLHTCMYWGSIYKRNQVSLDRRFAPLPLNNNKEKIDQFRLLINRMAMDWKNQHHKRGKEIMRKYANNGMKLVNIFIGTKLFLADDSSF